MNTDMKVEKYIDFNGNPWIRIKYLDRHRTEIIMTENEFKNKYNDMENLMGMLYNSKEIMTKGYRL